MGGGLKGRIFFAGAVYGRSLGLELILPYGGGVVVGVVVGSVVVEQS